MAMGFILNDEPPKEIPVIDLKKELPWLIIQMREIKEIYALVEQFLVTLAKAEIVELEFTDEQKLAIDRVMAWTHSSSMSISHKDMMRKTTKLMADLDIAIEKKDPT